MANLIKATFIQHIGVTCVKQIWVDLDTIKEVKYAQYNNAIQYVFKNKGGRKMFRQTVIEDTVLIAGWLDYEKQDLDGYVSYQTVDNNLESFLVEHKDSIIMQKTEKFEKAFIK